MPQSSPDPNMQPDQSHLGSPTGDDPPAASSDPGGKDPASHFRHEFRNMLQAILIQVQCTHIAMDKADTAAARSHLAHIESSVTQSRQLLDDFVPPRAKR
ncbi:MAG: hypothetical protein WD294_07435 [Phycisphaeraceae bacterium]